LRLLHVVDVTACHGIVDGGPRRGRIPYDVAIGVAAELGRAEEAPVVVAHEERAIRPVADEIVIVPTIADHHAREPERQCPVGSRPHAQPLIRLRGQPRASRIDDDERGAACLRVGHRRRLREIRGRRIVAPQQQASGARKIRRADVDAKRVRGHVVPVPGAQLFRPP